MTDELALRIAQLTAARAALHIAKAGLEEAIFETSRAVPSDHPCVRPIHEAHIEILKSIATLDSAIKRLRR